MRSLFVRTNKALIIKGYITGTAIPCCIDFEGRMPLGNVLKQTLKEIFNGRQYNLLRKQHLKHSILEDSICCGRTHASCRSKKEHIIEWFLSRFLGKVA